MLKTILHYVQKYGVFVLGAILLLTVAIRFAEPVKDGDLFWQMEYGRYLVENRTLVPDHAKYSWTPVDKNAIYCAWIGEIALYLMYELGGLTLLFAFRYLAILSLVWIVWTYARRMGQGGDAFTFLVLVVVLLGNFGATYLKPEIMSMVLLAATAGLYFSVKSSLWGKWGTRPFLLYPILFLIWVNTHGVFVFGVILLGCITFGEILNYFFSRQCALSKKGMGHLLTGALLSLAATLATPYGYSYHIRLYTGYLAPKGDENLLISSVVAWRSIFAPGTSLLHFVDFWVIMIVFITSLFAFCVWKRRSWDWAILLPNMFLAYMCTRYLRSAFYWPAFWGMSLIYLRNRVGPYWPRIPRAGTAFKAGIVLVFLFLAGRAIYDARYRPLTSRWLGFGVSYFNPAQACDFLKKHRPGKLLYNSYNVGGYLIHALYPTYKIFCDPRGFPYAEWYHEYLNFNNGPMPLEDFMKKFPFDVAIVDYYSSESPILKFLKSRKWEPVFYGPSAMIFVRSDVGFEYDLRQLDKHRFDDLRNLRHAYGICFVAQNLGALDTSAHILELIKKKFRHMANYTEVVEECTLYQEGLTAYAEGDYDRALDKLGILGNRQHAPRANVALIDLRNRKAKQLIRKGQYREAAGLLESTLQEHPLYVDGLYNAGVLAYRVEVLEKSKKQESGRGPSKAARLSLNENSANWRSYLERFLKLDPGHRHAWIAKQVLEGKGLPPNVTLIL